MSTTLRCILLDDEESNNTLLEHMLHDHCPQVQVVGRETDAENGIILIRELHPDLLFLDVEMPGLNGFQLLKQLEPVFFEVIFVTAHSEYALNAFDVQAMGYLTKPIDKDRLLKVVQVARERIQQKDTTSSIFTMLENRMKHRHETKVPLSTLNGLIFVNEEDIIYCESNGRYTFFHMMDGKKLVISKSIGEYEKILPDGAFVRIHDKYIINLKYVNEYIKGRGGEVKLNNVISLPVSVNRKEKLLSLFDQWMRRE
jgi:two-component system, LytTR family, response regulator